MVVFKKRSVYNLASTRVAAFIDNKRLYDLNVYRGVFAKYQTCTNPYICGGGSGDVGWDVEGVVTRSYLQSPITGV